jgi:hypothetical protein
MPTRLLTATAELSSRDTSAMACPPQVLLAPEYSSDAWDAARDVEMWPDINVKECETKRLPRYSAALQVYRKGALLARPYTHATIVAKISTYRVDRRSEQRILKSLEATGVRGTPCRSVQQLWNAQIAEPAFEWPLGSRVKYSPSPVHNHR